MRIEYENKEDDLVGSILKEAGRAWIGDQRELESQVKGKLMTLGPWSGSWDPNDLWDERHGIETKYTYKDPVNNEQVVDFGAGIYSDDQLVPHQPSALAVQMRPSEFPIPTLPGRRGPMGDYIAVSDFQ